MQWGFCLTLTSLKNDTKERRVNLLPDKNMGKSHTNTNMYTSHCNGCTSNNTHQWQAMFQEELQGRGLAGMTKKCGADTRPTNSASPCSVNWSLLIVLWFGDDCCKLTTKEDIMSWATAGPPAHKTARKLCKYHAKGHGSPIKSRD